VGGVPAPVGLTATAAKSHVSRELHKIAVNAAEDFAAELLGEDSCHGQTVLSQSFCWRERNIGGRSGTRGEDPLTDLVGGRVRPPAIRIPGAAAEIVGTNDTYESVQPQ
jgi:hypothetical protein